MNDSNEQCDCGSLPDWVQFEALDAVQKPGISSDSTMVETVETVKADSSSEKVDELQALNTALCFLCSINADAAEVVRFLRSHPQALLLEGTCQLPEDSAHFILEQQLRRCKRTCCRTKEVADPPPCHQNRLRLQQIIEADFPHHHHAHYAGDHPAELLLFPAREERDKGEESLWRVYFENLCSLERQIRTLRLEELLLRNTVVETTLKLRAYQEELHHIQRSVQHDGKKSSALSLLKCTRLPGNKATDDATDSPASRLTGLEYLVDLFAVKLRSTEREHANLLQRIREGRREQFTILKNAFEGCARHVCVGVASAPSRR
jgi:hypothetical protein